MPTISLVCICGDAGTKTLARMLASVKGRGITEVVIGWNGKDDAAFDAALKQAELGDLPVTIHRQEWKSDFAAARNEAHQQATGEWHFWLDTDDVLCEFSDPQVAEELKLVGVESAGGGTPESLSDYLIRVAASGFNAVALPYHYAVESDNRPLQRQWKIRLFRWTDGWIWEKRIHEDLRTTYGNSRKAVPNAGMLVRHLPEQNVRERLKRNAEINKLVVEELKARGDDLSHREWYNLGAIAFDDREFEQATEYLGKAAETAIKASAFEEAIVALDYLVRAQLSLNKIEAAIDSAFRMVKLYPNRPDGYVALIAAYYARQDWSALARWYYTFTTIKAPSVVAVENVIERNAWPRAWAAEALANLGDLPQAVAIATEAVKLAPNDVLCVKALEEISWLKEQAEAVTALHTLARFHLKHSGTDRAVILLSECAPPNEIDQFATLRAEIEDACYGNYARTLLAPDFVTWEQKLKDCGYDLEELSLEQNAYKHGLLRNQTDMQRRTSEEILERVTDSFHHVEFMDQMHPGCVGVLSYPMSDRAVPVRSYDITIYAPIHNEIWKPEQARPKGIGGSEEAIIYLSEELVQRGHNVTVYGPSDSPLAVRVVAGVRYRHFTDFRIKDDREVLISHRSPWLSAESPNAEHYFVWHHDHQYLFEAWNPTTAKIGKHLFVSDWQAKTLGEYVPGIPITGATIGNGVPREQTFDLKGKRDPMKVVYTSQPIRGLSFLLEKWPEVLETYPDAELHIFYGRHTNSMAASAGFEGVRKELEKIDLLLRNTPRVVDHGRVGHIELMREMHSASVWAYPAIYPEVSCIAGLRAALAGCIPVFGTRGNALGETQPDQTYAVSDLAMFVPKLKDALADGQNAHSYREKLRTTVLTAHTWDHVARRLMTALSEAETKAKTA